MYWLPELKRINPDPVPINLVFVSIGIGKKIEIRVPSCCIRYVTNDSTGYKVNLDSIVVGWRSFVLFRVLVITITAFETCKFVTERRLHRLKRDSKIVIFECELR